MLVWAITGLWHGASWNFVLWGTYYGILLVLEKYVWGKALSRAPRLFGHLYTIAIFVFGWSFFWITDPGTLIEYWQALLGTFGLTGDSTFWELTAWEYWPVFLTCTLASTPICPFTKEAILARMEGRQKRSINDAYYSNISHMTGPGTQKALIIGDSFADALKRPLCTQLSVLDATREIHNRTTQSDKTLHDYLDGANYDTVLFVARPSNYETMLKRYPQFFS